MSMLQRAFQALLTLSLVVWVQVGAAQVTDEARSFYESWNRTAERAEGAIEAARASNAALAVLRGELVSYRERFAAARENNAARIRVLQSQLDALGPAPDSEAGESEPEDLANARAVLRERLQELRVPVVLAQEAFGRANGLITELDRIVRERKTRALLERGPSPVNPVYWQAAIGDLADALRNLAADTTSGWAQARENGTLRKQLPLTLMLCGVGLLLTLRGRRWAGRLVDWLRRLGGPGSGVWSFIASLLRVILPYGGLVLFLTGLIYSGAVGVRGQLLLQALPMMGALLLAAMWLGDRVYPRRDEDALIPMPPSRRAACRRNMLALAGVYSIYLLIAVLENIENISAASRAVIGMVPIVLGSWFFYRLRSLAMAERATPEGSEANQGGVRKAGPTLRRIMTAVALTAPVLAALGYNAMAEAMVYPMILTLGLFGLLLVLHKFLSDAFGLVSRKSVQEVADSIMPAILSLLLAAACLPFLALIWGAEVANLTELWARFLAGFAVGGIEISPTIFLTFAAVFVIGYTITRMLQSALRNSLLPKTRLDAGGQTAIVSGTGYIGIFISALVAITVAGLDLSSLAIVAGALSVGIGFGLQTIVSNFVSGIILLIERPISKGDWIEVGGHMGYVRDISVRSTRIETFDRSDVIVPNSDLISGTVTNYTRGNTLGRIIVPVGVAYGSDTKQVEGILREIVEAHPMVLAVPPPSVLFRAFGADSLDFEIRAILRDVNWGLSVHSEINHQIAQRFTEEGIEIPFAQRDVWLRNPEALRAGTTGGDPAEERKS